MIAGQIFIAFTVLVIATALIDLIEQVNKQRNEKLK